MIASHAAATSAGDVVIPSSGNAGSCPTCAAVQQLRQSGPARTAAPELVERVGDGGQEVGGIGGADFLRLLVAAERLADGLEGRRAAKNSASSALGKLMLIT